MKGELWLGSEASAEGYIRYLEYVAANPLILGQTRAEVLGDIPEERDTEKAPRFESYLIKDFNNVGVISIKGGLTNQDNWITQLFGLTTYPEIIRAASELMSDDSITDIVLDIDSGGGTAQGIESVSRSLEAVAKVKPIHAATGGTMASAAYWIGATAKQLTSTGMAQLGSIGVIATHLSLVGMLEQAGVEATVVRAGKYKAPGSPYEKLSEQNQGILQKELDTLHGFFLDHVAEHRSLNVSTKAEWGEGQMFFGQEAIDVGLADKIMSPEALVVSLENTDAVDTGTKIVNTSDPGLVHASVADSKGTKVILNTIQNRPKVDNPSQPANNSLKHTGDSQMSLENRREVILHSEEDLAAIAAGAPLENFEHDEVTVEGDAPAASLEESTEVTEETAQLPEAEAGEQTATVSKLIELSAENAVLKRDLVDSQAKLVSSESVVDSLAAGLAAQTNRMEIGLRRSETNFSGMSSATVVEKYEATRKDFDAKFKVGRQTTQATGEPAQVARLGIVPRG